MADDKTYLALADEHQWKSFNDLSQIGITAGSETIMDIIVAMPEGSDLSYEIRASQHNHDAYPYPTGTITIKKYSDSACDVEHVCSANNEYRGTWRMYAVGSANTFILSDWIQVYDAVNPPEKISRESITPFTVDNAEEGSTQSFINFSTGGSVNGGIGFYGLLPYIMDDEGNLLGKIYHAGDKPTASDVGALKIYSTLSALGLTEATATAEAIVNAMEPYSVLFHSCGETATTAALAFPFTYGFLRVEKPASNGYVNFEYTGITDSKHYFGYYNHGTTQKWSGWRTDFIPLDGSVAMTNGLSFSNGYGRVEAGATVTELENWTVAGDTSNGVVLGIRGSAIMEKLIRLYHVVDGTETAYNIFGEHNKPSGTYSGNNGSQTIDTGGLGDVILVQLTGSGGGFALVTKSGAIGKLNSNNSVFALADTEAKFIGGVLTLNSSNYGVNRSGYGYNWQVL